MKLNNDALMAHRYKRSDHPLIRELEAALRRGAASGIFGIFGNPTNCVSRTMACIAVDEMTGDPHARIPDDAFERIWGKKDRALIAAIPYLKRYILGYDRLGIARWALPLSGCDDYSRWLHLAGVQDALMALGANVAERAVTTNELASQLAEQQREPTLGPQFYALLNEKFDFVAAFVVPASLGPRPADWQWAWPDDLDTWRREITREPGEIVKSMVPRRQEARS
jgi:hypothetical protein